MINRTAILEAVDQVLDAKTNKERDEALSLLARETPLAFPFRTKWWESSIRSCLSVHAYCHRWIRASRAPRNTWIGVCSWDGRIRESALRALNDGFPCGLSFALGLRRLNDWAPEVRAAARECFSTQAEKTDPKFAAEALWCTLPISFRWGRAQQEDFQVLYGLLDLPRIAEALAQKVISSPSGPSAQVLSQACRSPQVHDWLPAVAREAIMPSARVTAYSFLWSGEASWPIGLKELWVDRIYCKSRAVQEFESLRLAKTPPVLGLLAEAARDSSIIVRRAAAQFLSENWDKTEGIESTAEALAQDPVPSIAWRAKFALKKLAGDHTIEFDKSWLSPSP